MLSETYTGFTEEITRRKTLDEWRSDNAALSASTGVAGDAMKESNPYRLKSNQVASFSVFPSDPWTRQDVENFVRQNGLAYDLTYFPCGLVMSLVQQGSISSLGTTDLNRSQLPSPSVEPTLITGSKYYTDDVAERR